MKRADYPEATRQLPLIHGRNRNSAGCGKIRRHTVGFKRVWMLGASEERIRLPNLPFISDQQEYA
jgi:hypothetical protein